MAAISVDHREFESGERDQFAGLDEVGIQPGEQIEFLRTREFCGDDPRYQRIDPKSKNECPPDGGIIELEDRAGIAVRRLWQKERIVGRRQRDIRQHGQVRS